MKRINFNPIPYMYISVDEIYKNFAVGGKLYLDINTPYDLFLSLNKHCPD